MREWHKHDRSAQVYSSGMLFYVYDLHIQVKEYNVVCRGDTYMTLAHSWSGSQERKDFE